MFPLYVVISYVRDSYVCSIPHVLLRIVGTIYDSASEAAQIRELSVIVLTR